MHKKKRRARDIMKEGVVEEKKKTFKEINGEKSL